MVKVIAEESGIDITKYEKENSCKLRSSKAKLPGNEISVPSMPTLTLLKDDIKDLLDSGKLSRQGQWALTVSNSNVNMNEIENEDVVLGHRTL